MGSLIKAVCENCGYETELHLGGGMMDFDTNCSFPALNKSMNRIEERNIFKRDKEKNNPSHILFYDSESLVDKNSIRSKDHLNWDKYRLYDADYYCPKCGKFALKFILTGLFD
ncbi:MAG: hypothetical protein ACOCQ4_01190 [bacterium]